MNAITIPIEVELTPRSKAVMDALYQAIAPQFQSPPPAAAPTIELQPGEHYAGVVLDTEGKVMHHLVLMAQKPNGKLNWKDAMDWAASAGGHLPTRQEQALLYANCKPHLQPGWHWSCESHEEDASYAWNCNFGYGDQLISRKSYEGSAVAVRRF
jgi:hypothetical protein